MDMSTARSRLLAELRDLRSTLEKRRETGGLAESQQEATGALSSYDQHPGDSASTTFQRTRDLAIEDRLQQEIDEVEGALERIEQGTYGECQVCGDEIETERLRARPQARFCREHHSENEG